MRNARINGPSFGPDLADRDVARVEAVARDTALRRDVALDVAREDAWEVACEDATDAVSLSGDSVWSGIGEGILSDRLIGSNAPVKASGISPASI